MLSKLVIGLQSSVDLPEQTQREFWLGVLIIAGLLVAGLWILYRTEYAGIPKSNAQHRQALESGKLDQTPRRVRIRAGEHAAAYRDRLLAAFDASPSRIGEHDDPSVLDAIVHARGELAAAWQPVHDRLPTPAVRALELAALLAVFGALAVSSDRLVTWLLHGSPDRGAGDAITDATTLLVDGGIDVLTAFPYVGDLTALLLSVGLIATTTAYEYWYVSATLVAVVGLVLVYLDAVSSDDTDLDVVLVDRRTIAVGVTKWTLIVWLAGVAPVAVASTAGTPPMGVLAGVVFAAIAAAVASKRGIDHVAGALYQTAGIQHGARHHLARPLRRVDAWLDSTLPESSPDDQARFQDGEDPIDVVRDHLEYDPEYAALELDKQLREASDDWPVATRDHTRWDRVQAVADALLVITARVTSVVLALGTLLLAAYVAVAVALDGSLWTVTAATMAAPLPRQALVGALVATPLAVAAYQARQAWPSLRAALADVWARQRVRTALLRRGVPVGVVLAVYPVTALFTSGFSWPWGLLAGALVAAAAGVAVRGAISMLYRARYRVDLTPGDENTPRAAVCHVYDLQDADGTARACIEVNGSRRLLGSDRSVVVDDALLVADAVTNGRDVPATESERRAEYAFEYGLVDETEAREKLWERARKEIVTPLREAGGVMERDDHDAELDQLPDVVARERFADLRQQGVVRRDAEYVYLEHDPWVRGHSTTRSLFSRLLSRG